MKALCLSGPTDRIHALPFFHTCDLLKLFTRMLRITHNHRPVQTITTNRVHIKKITTNWMTGMSCYWYGVNKTWGQGYKEIWSMDWCSTQDFVLQI